MTALRKGILLIISQSWVLSVILTVIFSLIFIGSLREYDIHSEYISSTSDRSSPLIFDLDQDRNPDRVFANHRPDLGDEFNVLRFHKGIYSVIDDYVVPGKLNEYSSFSACDIDSNGYAEVFFFTHSDDSLFVNAVEFNPAGYSKHYRRFLAMVYPGKAELDIVTFTQGFSDLDLDGNIDFLFIVNAGYALQPRQVYAWTPRTDKLISSPPAAHSIGFEKHHPPGDLNGDGRKELLVSTGSPRNFVNAPPPYDTIKFLDTAAYLVALDDELQYLFPPEPSPFNRVSPVACKYDGADFVSIVEAPSGEQALGFYSCDGKMLDMMIIPEMQHAEDEYSLFALPDGRGYLIANTNRQLWVDDEFNIKDPNLDLPGAFKGIYLDITGDGEAEYILQKPGEIIVANTDFEPLGGITIAKTFTRIDITAWPSQDGIDCYVTTEDSIYKFKAIQTTLYTWRFAVILTFFLLALILVTGITWIQRTQLKRQQREEKESLRLQMQAVKNQVDPHFAMNAMNSVLYYIREKRDQDAQDFLTRYARLMQKALTTSDKVVTTLGEELDFVKSYLDLERSRPDYAFDYIVEITDKRLLDCAFPRTLLHTYAENAVKYAMRPNKGKGEMFIWIRGNNDVLEVELQDNGPGFDLMHGQIKGSTGKGLDIGREISRLYSRLSGKKVDIMVRSGEQQGTTVTIRIK